MPNAWPDEVEEILASDQVVMLGSVTPAGGVVLTPVTNFAARDRAAGTVTVNSSIAASRKLERIARHPQVALAFHTRTHSLTTRPEYVLLQGNATISDPIPDYPTTIRDNWERFAGRLEGRAWRWWMGPYFTRVDITVTAHRISVWPDLTCRDPVTIHGTPPTSQSPPSQQPPPKGTDPRLDVERATRRAARLPHTMVGWVDADGYPFVVPVEVGNAQTHGITLHTARPLLPPGERRAGLTAHAFTRHVVGQHQRIHTGWLRTDPDLNQATYAPHTAFGYHMPPSRLFYRLSVGIAVRHWNRRSQRNG
jgi:general stress protein 26